MSFPHSELSLKEFPPLLREISDPPKKLFVRGTLPRHDYMYLCVVGSRSISAYAKDALGTLIKGLAGTPISVVSGLAIGTDAEAHKAALQYGLHTIAVPGSGISDAVMYPRSNRPLAQKILDSGGALLSEFEPDFQATPWSFPARNRIMAGMSPATLIIEASEKSGTLITARLALEYNRDVLCVPGSIFNKNTFGPHMLIKNGATPITESRDILEALNIRMESAAQARRLSRDEENVVSLLQSPLPRDELIRKLKVPVSQANVLLMSMELKGLIKETSGALRMID
jgi:DNA processing protein